MVAATATLSGAAAAAATVDRTPTQETVSPGDQVTVELDVTADQGDGIEVVSESFPQELSIADSSSTQTQVLTNPASWEVVYLSPVDSDTISVTYDIPSDAAGETYTLSGDVVTSNDQVSSGTTTINVQSQAPDFALDESQLGDVSVDQGDVVSPTVTVENVGTEAGSTDVEFVVNGLGTVDSATTGTIAPGESEDVTLSTTANVPTGSYTWFIQADNGNVQSATYDLTVSEPPAGDAPEGEISVESFEIANQEKALLSEEVQFTRAYDDSENVGPVLGVPVQTGFFDDRTSPSGVDFADDGEFTASASNFVTYTVGQFDIVANNTEEDENVVLEFDDANELGLDVNPEESTLPNGDALADADFVTVNNDVGEIVFNIDSVSNENEGIDYSGLTLAFEAADQTEGLNFEDPVEALTLRASGSDISEEDSRILAYDSGITGISEADAENFDGREEINGAIAAADAEPGAYGQFVGSLITIQTDDDDDTVEIYEADRADTDDDNNREYTLGDRIDSRDTAPSDTTALDTSNLGAGEYFIGFDEQDNFSQSDFVFLDLRELNLEASAEDVPVTEAVEVEVTSTEDDAIRATGDVQVWVREAGDDEIGEVIYADDDQLLGVTGDTEFRIDPDEELNGEEEYQAIVLHEDSGITTTTTFEVQEPEVEAVRFQDASKRYTRGDVVPVELNMQNTETGTITFGDQDTDQNVEINITVRDADEDGSAKFWINTFQIGDGPVADDEDGNANHGIRSAEGTAIRSIDADGGMQIAGGSASASLITATDERERVVIADGGYDLYASPGNQPYMVEDSITTDRGQINLSPRETGNISLWESPFPRDQGTIEDAELVSTIRDQIGSTVTPQEGDLADNDVLAVNITATGLEGYLLDALEEQDNDGTIETDEDEIIDFLVERDDDVVTEAFDAAAERYLGDRAEIGFGTEQTEADIEQIANERNIEVDPATLDLQNEEILGNLDEDADALNEYWVTIHVEDDNIVDDEGAQATADELPVEWETTFTLNTTIADSSEDFRQNDPFGGDISQSATWSLLEDEVTLDGVEEGLLSVPARDGYTITGETPIAAGTEINYNIGADSNEEQVFFFDSRDEGEEPVTVEYVEDAPNTIAFDIDFAEYPGVGFSADLQRARGGSSLIDPALRDQGAGVNGQIRQVAVASTHTFEDQTSGGAVVRIAEVDVNQPGAIEIENADGDVIGSTSIPEGASSDVRILLDDELEESQDLTSVLVDEDGEEFDANASSADVRTTATVTVGTAEEGSPFLNVNELSPVAATAEPGQELTVSATITNVGDAAADAQDIEFLLDGQPVDVVDAQSVSLEPGASQTVEFTVTAPEEAGTYEHEISSGDDNVVGSLTVEEPEPVDTDTGETDTGDETDTGNETDDGDADDGGPGFGIAAAVIALLGAALLAYRRRDE